MSHIRKQSGGGANFNDKNARPSLLFLDRKLLSVKIYGTISKKLFKKYDGSMDICVSACSLPGYLKYFTVIRFVLVSAKFACTVVTVNGTLVETKMCPFTLKFMHFIFNKCPIYTHDCASVLLSTGCDETDFCTVWDRQGTVHQILDYRNSSGRKTVLYARQEYITSESPV